MTAGAVNPPWSAEAKATLRRLRLEEKLSYAAIAERMGVSKNAVCGQAKRIGIAEPGNNPIKRLPRAEQKRRERRKDPSARAALPPPRSAPPRQAALRLVSSAEGAARHDLIARVTRCQWIEGEPTGDDACKCGGRAVEGTAWCADHLARIWRPRETAGGEVRR